MCGNYKRGLCSENLVKYPASATQLFSNTIDDCFAVRIFEAENKKITFYLPRTARQQTFWSKNEGRYLG